MLLAACISGVPLLATWGSIQRAPTLGHILSHEMKGAKEYTQFWSAVGAVLGSFGGALLAGWRGRRLAYVLLCLASLGSCWLFFQTSNEFGAYFLFTAAIAGAATAAFYGWLPLYLPELFPTRVRATGQGFGYNAGRVIAAIGALSTGYLTKVVFGGNFAAVFEDRANAVSELRSAVYGFLGMRPSQVTGSSRQPECLPPRIAQAGVLDPSAGRDWAPAFPSQAPQAPAR